MSAGTPRISVVITTRNGADTIEHTLRGLTALEAPSGGWELVMVDNDSTDGTSEILQRYTDQLPMVLLNETRRGQTVGQNVGAAAARGELLIFSDDDSVPPPHWLKAYERAAREHPECDIFGGPVIPQWEADPPPWIDECVPAGIQGVAFVRLDARADGPFPAKRFHGPNFALRSTLMQDRRIFDETIGPNGNPDYAMGSETAVLMQLQAQGHEAWFVSDAHVDHHVLAEQFEESWLMGRAVRFGRGQQRMRERRYRPSHWLPGRLPGLLLWRLLRTALAAKVCGMLGRRRQRFVNSWDHHRYLGMARQLRESLR